MTQPVNRRRRVVPLQVFALQSGRHRQIYGRDILWLFATEPHKEETTASSSAAAATETAVAATTAVATVLVISTAETAAATAAAAAV